MSVLAAIGMWAAGIVAWVLIVPVLIYEFFSAIVVFHLDLPGKRSKFLPNIKF